MTPKDSLPLDHQVIAQLIEPGSRVLDLGCGEGDLMFVLAQTRQAKVQGVELNEQSIYKCVEKGLSVFHSDIDTGLSGYPDQSFDYVILNQSLQEIKRVDFVLQEAMRVGRKVIVGFPNFALLQARVMLFFRGRAPRTRSLPYEWHNTPNLRFLSIRDFASYCAEKKIRVIKRVYLGEKRLVHFFPNLFALNAIFVLTRS